MGVNRVTIKQAAQTRKPFILNRREPQRGSRVELWLHGVMCAFLDFDWRSNEMSLDVVDDDAVIKIMDQRDESDAQS